MERGKKKIKAVEFTTGKVLRLLSRLEQHSAWGVDVRSNINTMLNMSRKGKEWKGCVRPTSL